MTQNDQLSVSPQFEGVWFMDDDNTLLCSTLNTPQGLLSPDAARGIILNPEGEKYLQLSQPNGKPYYDTLEGGEIRRHFIFVDPQAPEDVNTAIDFVFNIGESNGVITVLPHEIRRAPDADFVASVTYACCASGGRTMLYSDTRSSGDVFLNLASSGADVRAQIRTAWNATEAKVLDAGGMAALHHLILDMTGKCGGHHAGHALLSDYGRTQNWAGFKLSGLRHG